MTSAKRDIPSSPSSGPPAAKKLRSSPPPEPFVHSTPSSHPVNTSVSSIDNGQGDEDGFTKVLTRDERRKQKKMDKHKPAFQFDLGQFRNGKKIGIAHVRDFVLYLLTDSAKPQWIVTDNKGNISHVVVLLIPGLLPEHIGLDIPLSANLPFTTHPTPTTEAPSPQPLQSQIPIINQIYLRGVPTRAPGDGKKLHSVMQALLNPPIPDGRRKELEKERNKEREARERRAAEQADDATTRQPPFGYLLTPNQMADNGYNLPSYIPLGDSIIVPGRPAPVSANGVGAVAGPSTLPSADKVDPAPRPLNEGWMETEEATAEPEDGRWPVFSMDCEMVLTTQGSQLARVSIIDYYTGLVVFDELVIPSDEIVDYRTQWSGMTKERLSQATHTLASVQKAIMTGPGAIFTPHTILLGHSLECDLNALQIRHPLCLDTALMYKHPRGTPYKPALRWLSSKYMQKEIQNGSQGHDSAEDARACIGLLRLKEENEFGVFDDYSESIFDRLKRHTSGRQQGDEQGKTSAVIDYSSTKSGHGAKATTCVKCDTDDEIVSNMIAEIPKHDFTFGRMMELANHLGFNGTEDNSPGSAPTSTILADLNARLTRLHAVLPKHTAFIVLNGHSDPKPMLEMSQRRAKWERAMREKANNGDWIEGEDRWMAEDDRELERRVALAREGMAFFCVK